MWNLSALVLPEAGGDVMVEDEFGRRAYVRASAVIEHPTVFVKWLDLDATQREVARLKHQIFDYEYVIGLRVCG
jgi:hypothetical protein